jgi:CrcB protein
MKSLLVFIGAGLGGNARYWFGGWVSSVIDPTYPWGTFVVNVTGCLLIGLAAGLLIDQQDALSWRLFVITGFLGGYTTFSSFSLETIRLFSEKGYGQAIQNVLASCLVGLAATWLGLALAKVVSRT